MSKTIGLKQLSEKRYNLVQGLPAELTASIGMVEEAWDAIIYGPSGNGKTNFTIKLLKELIVALNAKAEYVSYEEGHGATVQEAMINRHDMLSIVGNKLQITDILSYDDLVKRMARKQSAKIWVIDSLQAAGFNYQQCKGLKERFVLSRKKKIIIYISWGEGIKPIGATARDVEFYANIKMRVEGFIMFPKSRYGGNKPYVIWEGNEREGAKYYWGKDYYKVSGIPKPPKLKKTSLHLTAGHEPVTKMQIAEPQIPVFKDNLNTH
jgi:hypothetical protein